MSGQQEKTAEESGGNLWTSSPSDTESQLEGVDASEFSREAVEHASFDEKALEERLKPYRRKVRRQTLDKVLK
ncbi:MAG: hypothetical protein ACOCV2_10935 [Persicimonas sp.]